MVETLLRVFQGLGCLQDPVRRPRYAWRIARRVLQERKEGVLETVRLANVAEPQVLAHHPAELEMAELVQFILSRLPVDEGRLFRQVFLEERKPRELPQVQEIGINAVICRIYR